VANFVGVAVDHQQITKISNVHVKKKRGLRPNFNADYHNVCFVACLSPAAFSPSPSSGQFLFG
jgi:hypothetical protein